LSAEATPTVFVLTSHENDHFDYKIYAGMAVSNVIFKPFEIFDKFYYNEKVKGWEL
jgi:hypothetical protein